MNITLTLLGFVSTILFTNQLSSQIEFNIDLIHVIEKAEHESFKCKMVRSPLSANNDYITLIKIDPKVEYAHRDLWYTRKMVDTLINNRIPCYSPDGNNQLDSIQLLNALAHKYFDKDHQQEVVWVDVNSFERIRVNQTWRISSDLKIEVNDHFHMPIRRNLDGNYQETCKMVINDHETMNYDLNDPDIIWIKQTESVHPILESNGLLAVFNYLFEVDSFQDKFLPIDIYAMSDDFRSLNLTEMHKLLNENQDKIAGFAIKQFWYYSKSKDELYHIITELAPVVPVFDDVSGELVYYQKLLIIGTQ